MTCADCKWWESWEFDALKPVIPDAYGACRRFPPYAHPKLDDIATPNYSYWPITASDEWCGEHREQDNHKEK